MRPIRSVLICSRPCRSCLISPVIRSPLSRRNIRLVPGTCGAAQDDPSISKARIFFSRSEFHGQLSSSCGYLLSRQHPTLRVNLVRPGQPGVLPTIHQSLAIKNTIGIFDCIPFHAVGDVVDVFEPGFRQQVDRHRTTATGPARDQQDVVRLRDVLHSRNKIRQAGSLEIAVSPGPTDTTARPAGYSRPCPHDR